MPSSVSPASPASHEAGEDATISRRNTLVIALLLVSTFVVILNETIMSVALPRLMIDLDVSAAAAQWLTTAFLLTMATVIPITGYLIQRIHTRPLFILAMSLFSIGTLCCALSPSLAPLIAGRVVQALGTAIMLPLLMTTVMTLVPVSKRGTVMGNISIVISVAPAIGPAISGLILDSLGWRWMFWLVLPIGLAALALGVAKIKNVTEPRYAPLDYLSVVLSAFGFGGLVYGLSAFGEGGGATTAVPVWLPLVVGGVAMVLFILRQMSLQKREKALLDLRTFHSRTFALAVMMMAIAMGSMLGIIILLPIYTQNVLGFNPLQTGLLLLPGGLVMGALAPLVGRLYDRFGPTPLLVPGTIVVSAVLWALTGVGETTGYWTLTAGHIALSVGLALLFTPLFTASLSAVPPKLYSHGSAILGSTQQLAGAAGIALFISVMTATEAGLVSAGAQEVSALAGGLQAAFMAGAILSLVNVAASFFIRKPDAYPEAEPETRGAPAAAE